jgi:hypothetical protein
MPLATDVDTELEPLKTLITPKLTLIFLSSSLDLLMEALGLLLYRRIYCDKNEVEVIA